MRSNNFLTAAATGVAARAAVAVLALLPAFATVAAVVDTDPGQLIESAAQAMLADLDAHRAEYRKDPARITKLFLLWFDVNPRASHIARFSGGGHRPF